MLTPIRTSLRYKLALVVLATAFAALLMAGVALVWYDLRGYRVQWEADLATQADILGRASRAALEFDDAKAANENLALLKARPRVRAAAIYGPKGKLFAGYERPGARPAAFPSLAGTDGARVVGDEMLLFRRVVDEGEVIGTVYIRADYELGDRLLRYLGILGTVMVISLLLAFPVYWWLQRVLTHPILSVARTARRVVDTRDFSQRARKTTEDEVGQLVDAFNAMLTELGRRAEALEQSRQSLEEAHQELSRRAERLRILQQIDRAIVAEEKIEAIAEAVLRPLRELLGVPRAIVNLFDHDKQEVEWLAAVGRHRLRIGGVRYPLKFAGDIEALRRGEPQRIETSSMPPSEHVDALLASGVRVYVVVPMIANRELIGSISFGGEQAEFSDEQMAIAQEVAAQLAIAIAQARMHATIARHAEEMERRVAERTAQLEEANKELEGFSYSVSHDLRAPLRGVIGFADALMEDHGPELNEEARRKIAVIQGEGRRMGVLIDELLAFSRLGRKQIQKVDLDMTRLARASLEGLQPQRNGSALDLHVGNLPPARGDRVLLGQVWTNLISNAIKFSAKRERPRVEVSAISDDREHIYFVRDNGAGFDPRYQAKLFGVFQRLHGQDEFPGTGVGLALVQRIVHRHGGRVWAEGRPGEGATFYFTLPKEQPDGAV